MFFKNLQNQHFTLFLALKCQLVRGIRIFSFQLWLGPTLVFLFLVRKTWAIVSCFQKHEQMHLNLNNTSIKLMLNVHKRSPQNRQLRKTQLLQIIVKTNCSRDKVAIVALCSNSLLREAIPHWRLCKNLGYKIMYLEKYFWALRKNILGWLHLWAFSCLKKASGLKAFNIWVRN